MHTDDEDDDDLPRSRRIFGLVGLLILLAIPVAVIWWPGCRQYPPVSSRESLTLMKLLYSACNTRSSQRLEEVERRLAILEDQSKLTPEEKEGFDRIITMAKAGNWEDAEAAAFKFAQDQVGQGDDSPDRHEDHKHPPSKRKARTP